MLLKLLIWIWRRLGKLIARLNPSRALRLNITFRLPEDKGSTTLGVQKMAIVATKIDNTQKVKASLNPTDVNDVPAKVDGSPVWVVVSGDATLSVDADGMGAYLISGADGETLFDVTGDADLGAGVETITERISLMVGPGVPPVLKANKLGITFAAPEPK